MTFDNSGQTDIVRHKENGYLARWKDSESLAEGIVWAATGNDIDRERLRSEVLDTFSERVVAEQYIDIYEKVKGGDKGKG